MEVLKVSSRSVPNSVAGAIAGVIRENKSVEIQAVGAGAANRLQGGLQDQEVGEGVPDGVGGDSGPGGASRLAGSMGIVSRSGTGGRP